MRCTPFSALGAVAVGGMSALEACSRPAAVEAPRAPGPTREPPCLGTQGNARGRKPDALRSIPHAAAFICSGKDASDQYRAAGLSERARTQG